jgi:hypothetical protein
VGLAKQKIEKLFGGLFNKKDKGTKLRRWQNAKVLIVDEGG